MTRTRGGGSLPGNRRTLVGKEFGFHSTVFETEIGRSEDVSKEICKGLSDCRIQDIQDIQDIWTKDKSAEEKEENTRHNILQC